jgi:hypothetical protein
MRLHEPQDPLQNGAAQGCRWFLEIAMSFWTVAESLKLLGKHHEDGSAGRSLLIAAVPAGAEMRNRLVRTK